MTPKIRNGQIGIVQPQTVQFCHKLGRLGDYEPYQSRVLEYTAVIKADNDWQDDRPQLAVRRLPPFRSAGSNRHVVTPVKLSTVGSHSAHAQYKFDQNSPDC